MPELPDLEVYVEHLSSRLVGQKLVRVRLGNPFLVRTFSPKVDDVFGETVRSVHRMAKRIVFGFSHDYYFVIHLMIAGRFRWRPTETKLPGKLGLAAFDFENGTLLLTEAGTKRRASLHVVQGKSDLQALNPGGIEPLDATLAEFTRALTNENHTLKRTLTDPHIFSGIGNAYSDEILHRARLSPVRLSKQLKPDEMERLWKATKKTLKEWVATLRKETGKAFPEEVTAFREEMAVHGKFGKPCPDCGSPVQRIRYSENEANYCARCQTEGRLLADRSLSRLLKGDWPKSIDELERRTGRAPDRERN